MAGYLLYFPGRSGQDPKMLDEAGLGSLRADGGTISFTHVERNGPDGKGGALCYWDDQLHPERVPFAGVKLLAQEWRELPRADGQAAVWVGWGKDAPPTPADLERKKMHGGRCMLLRDGQQWLVPEARQLPLVLGLGDARVEDIYKPFWDAAWKVVSEWLVVGPDSSAWHYRVESRDGEMGALEFAALALAQNYRLTFELVRALELFNTDLLCEALDITTNGLALAALFQKKTDPATSTTPTTGSGEAA